MLCIAGSTAILSGCSSAVRLLPLPTNHPASAEAPEPTPPPRSEILRSEAAAPSAMPEQEPTLGEKASESPSAHGVHAGHGSGHAAAPVVYTCPVHPTVKMDEPGSCPICGMSLVKKEEGPPHEQQEH